MRVAVVHFQSGNNEVKKTAEALARGIMTDNHLVELIDGEIEPETRITNFDYIVVGGSPISFFSGKISDTISAFLKNCGSISGKRSYAFIRKRGLSSSKALKKIMIEMEKEGMLLKTSDVLVSADEAEVVGKKLHIKK